MPRAWQKQNKTKQNKQKDKLEIFKLKKKKQNGNEGDIITYSFSPRYLYPANAIGQDSHSDVFFSITYFYKIRRS